MYAQTEATSPQHRGAFNFLRGKGIFFVLLAAAAIVAGIPIAISIFAPQSNSSIVISLCAAGQFFISIFAGIAWSKAEAMREANMRWVPMAASACDRLATILGSVSSLRCTVGQACSNASENLPELKEHNNRALRIHFEGLCNSNATRLRDVESHLDSALADWERFIKNNCEGSECADIGRRLALLRSRLPDDLSTTGQNCGNGQGRPSKPLATYPAIDQLELIVSTVSENPSLNGRWKLHQIHDAFWECGPYILRKDGSLWFLQQRDDSNNYFYMESSSSPCGVYQRCDVCPYDGNAVVFNPARPAQESSINHLQLITDGSPTSVPNSQNTNILDLAIALDSILQHVIHKHGVPKEKLLDAIRNARDMKEYSVMLGIDCPDAVSICAVPVLNVARGAMGLSAFEFDNELHDRICAKVIPNKTIDDQGDSNVGSDEAPTLSHENSNEN